MPAKLVGIGCFYVAAKGSNYILAEGGRSGFIYISIIASAARVDVRTMTYVHTAHSLQHRKTVYKREDMNIEEAQAAEGRVFDTEIHLETLGEM